MSGFRDFLKTHVPAVAAQVDHAEQKFDNFVNDPATQERIGNVRASVTDAVDSTRQAFDEAREQAPGMFSEAKETAKVASRGFLDRVSKKAEELKHKI